MIAFDADTGQYYFNPKSSLYPAGHRGLGENLSPLEEAKRDIQHLNERIFKIHKALRERKQETPDTILQGLLADLLPISMTLFMANSVSLLTSRTRPS